ncbi:MAG: hypothetical protein JWN23_2754 [Rhodocyclales bacterium]|nr:hypothetical protein [Rhodocyclales bacterium]
MAPLAPEKDTMNDAMNDARTPIGKAPATVEQIAQGRRTMLLLFGVCVLPVLAAYFAFYVWHPSAQASHGTVISPAQALPMSTLQTIDGTSLSAAMRGKWVLAVRAPSACDKDCRQQLYYTRQIRTIQAADMDRVARLWVFDDTGKPDVGLLAEHPDLLVVSDAKLANALGATGHIVLIDPRGNLMMRFAENPDPKGIVQDLQKLLKYSR